MKLRNLKRTFLFMHLAAGLLLGWWSSMYFHMPFLFAMLCVGLLFACLFFPLLFYVQVVQKRDPF
jgi:hypothetical protein